MTHAATSAYPSTAREALPTPSDARGHAYGARCATEESPRPRETTPAILQGLEDLGPLHAVLFLGDQVTIPERVEALEPVLRG